MFGPKLLDLFGFLNHRRTKPTIKHKVRRLILTENLTDDEVADCIRNLPAHCADAIYDIKNTCLVSQALAPISKTATGPGPAVDCKTSTGRTNVIISNGVVTGSAIWTAQMQGSVDNVVAYASEGDANALSGQITAAGITVLSYNRTFRYQKALFTLVSGTSSLISAELIEQLIYAPSGAGYDRSPST